MPLGDPGAVDHGGALARVEVEHHQVGRLAPVPRAEPPLRHVQLQRGQVGRPGQPLDVVDHREVGVLRAPARRADPGGADPVRGVPGHVLLEERRLLHPVRPAHHRDRPVPQVRQHHVGDGQVVGQHVGLGRAGERVEHLAGLVSLARPTPRRARAAPAAARLGRRAGAGPGGDLDPVARCGVPAVRASRRRLAITRAGPAGGRRGQHLRPAVGEHRGRAASAGPAAAAPPAAPGARGTAAHGRRGRPGAAGRRSTARRGRSSSPSSSTWVAPSDGPELAQRPGRRQLLAVGVGDPGPAALHPDDHPPAAEPDLQPPAVAAGERAGGGRHRAGRRGGAARGRGRGRSGAAASCPCRARSRPVWMNTYRPRARSPCSDDDDLARVPLLGLVGAGVPDRHLRRRRTRRPGSRRRTPGTPSGGPRCAPPAAPCPGSVGRPLGTAQDASTPSRSRRTSQCSRRAWCSWMTKRSSGPGCRVGRPGRAPGCAAHRACGGTPPAARRQARTCVGRRPPPQSPRAARPRRCHNKWPRVPPHCAYRRTRRYVRAMSDARRIDVPTRAAPPRTLGDWATGDEPMTGPQKSYLETLARKPASWRRVTSCPRPTPPGGSRSCRSAPEAAASRHPPPTPDYPAEPIIDVMTDRRAVPPSPGPLRPLASCGAGAAGAEGRRAGHLLPGPHLGLDRLEMPEDAVDGVLAQR